MKKQELVIRNSGKTKTSRTWSLQFSVGEGSVSVLIASGIRSGSLGRGFLRGGSLGSGLATFGGKGGGASNRFGVSVATLGFTAGFAAGFGGFTGGSGLFPLISFGGRGGRGLCSARVGSFGRSGGNLGNTEGSSDIFGGSGGF